MTKADAVASAIRALQEFIENPAFHSISVSVQPEPRAIGGWSFKSDGVYQLGNGAPISQSQGEV